jgi:hypothetical protein
MYMSREWRVFVVSKGHHLDETFLGYSGWFTEICWNLQGDGKHAAEASTK